MMNFDDRTDEEIVQDMVDESVSHIHRVFGPDDDPLEVLESLVIAFQTMIDTPNSAGYSRHDRLLPECLVEVQIRLGIERSRRLGQIH